MTPLHNFGVLGREPCSDRRSTCGRNRRAVLRFLVAPTSSSSGPPLASRSRSRCREAKRLCSNISRPYLAGRKAEEAEFRRLLAQNTILENLILTGLRGVGKTVLSESFKPIAIQQKWAWVGTDLSEATSVSESNLAIRIITDLSVVTSGLTLNAGEKQAPTFRRAVTHAEASSETTAVRCRHRGRLYSSSRLIHCCRQNRPSLAQVGQPDLSYP